MFQFGIGISIAGTSEVDVERDIAELPQLAGIDFSEGTTRPRWSHAFSYTYVLGWDGTCRVTFSQRPEVIHKVAIVVPFALLLPTHRV